MPATRLTVHDLGPTMAIWAHPDDETYLCGAILAALRDRGERVVCVTATRGEAADPDASEEQRRGLATLRTEELEAAAAILGVDEHVWLDLPDGGCADLDPGPVVDRLVGLADEMEARTLLTFGPDGVTGHPDHRAVSAWVATAAPRMRTRPRLLHAVTTAADRERFREFDDSLNVYYLGEPRICAADELVVDHRPTGTERERKVRALLAQASQTEAVVEALGLDRYADWVSRETFAHPE